jgi:hypothetical protein
MLPTDVNGPRLRGAKVGNQVTDALDARELAHLPVIGPQTHALTWQTKHAAAPNWGERELSRFHLQHYTSRLRYSYRWRYRLPREVWRLIVGLARLAPSASRVALHYVAIAAGLLDALAAMLATGSRDEYRRRRMGSGAGAARGVALPGTARGAGPVPAAVDHRDDVVRR